MTQLMGTRGAAHRESNMAIGMRVVVFLFLVTALFAHRASAQSTDSNKTTSSVPTSDAQKEFAPKRVRVNQGVLKPIHRVDPAYPDSARNTAGNGKVSLKVIIATDGSVKEVQRISGNEQLAASAMSAVKQWKYKPLSLKGSPVEVETQVDVQFSSH